MNPFMGVNKPCWGLAVGGVSSSLLWWRSSPVMWLRRPPPRRPLAACSPLALLISAVVRRSGHLAVTPLINEHKLLINYSWFLALIVFVIFQNGIVSRSLPPDRNQDMTSLTPPLKRCVWRRRRAFSQVFCRVFGTRGNFGVSDCELPNSCRPLVAGCTTALNLLYRLSVRASLAQCSIFNIIAS